METDDQYRLRLLKVAVLPTHLAVLSHPGYPDVVAAIGRDLGIPRIGTPDPFGDRITEALRREDDVVPHPVRRVETRDEVDALWRSVEEYGRGG